MRLADVLECDAGTRSRRVVAQNLGDRYLMAHSPVYRAIRELFLARGGRIRVEPGPVVTRYLGFPLLALPEVLRTRTVPCFDNVTPLRAVVREAPHLSISASFLVTGLRRNFLLHESSHCIADDVARRLRAFGTPRRRALALLVAESFANTMDLLLMSMARDSWHVLYAACNSYAHHVPERQREVSRLVARAGMGPVARMMILAFLHANAGRGRLGPRRALDLADAALGHDGPARERARLARAARFAFGLARGFRTETADAYFSLIGLGREREALRTLDVLADPDGPACMDLGARLASVVAERVE